MLESRKQPRSDSRQAQRRRPAQLPPGRHGLSRGFVVTNQRERILAAVADAVAEKGYGRLTVQDIVCGSGVSRRTFYDQFADKRAAFFAAYDACTQQAMFVAADAFSSAEGWRAQIRSSALSFLEYLANDPAFTRMGFVEIPLAGPEGYARHMLARSGFEVFLAPGAELATHPVPPIMSKAIGAGIFKLIHARVVAGRTRDLLELLPICVYCCVAPYLGVAAAVLEAETAHAMRASRHDRPGIAV